MSFGIILQSVADGSYFIYLPFKAWLFLFSTDYRSKMKNKWKTDRDIVVVRDVLGLILGFLFSILLVGFGLYLLKYGKL